MERRKWRTEQKEWLEEQLPKATGRYGPLWPCSLTSFVLVSCFVRTYTSCEYAAYVLQGPFELLSRSPGEAATAAAGITYTRVACIACVVMCKHVQKCAWLNLVKPIAMPLPSVKMREERQHTQHGKLHTELVALWYL